MAGLGFGEQPRPGGGDVHDLVGAHPGRLGGREERPDSRVVVVSHLEGAQSEVVRAI